MRIPVVGSSLVQQVAGIAWNDGRTTVSALADALAGIQDQAALDLVTLC